MDIINVKNSGKDHITGKHRRKTFNVVLQFSGSSLDNVPNLFYRKRKRKIRIDYRTFLVLGTSYKKSINFLSKMFQIKMSHGLTLCPCKN